MPILRRVMVEAAWAYQHKPWVGGFLLKRPADIRVINRRICSSLPSMLLLTHTLPKILLRAFLDRVYFGFT